MTEDPNIASQPEAPRQAQLVLLVSVCIIATCAIVYELVIATISSYLLGNSVYQFSITIGLFMSSMGLGSFLSKFVKGRLIDYFVGIEIAIGLVGGTSAAVLLFVYGQAESDLAYTITMVAIVVAIGAMIGLEIPILMRIAKQYGTLRTTLANVLAFDYVGALVGSLAFPLLLLKAFGLIQTAFLMGLLNALVAAAVVIQYWKSITRHAFLAGLVCAVTLGLSVCSIAGRRIEDRLEARLYADQIVLTKQSEYQRIVMTRLHDSPPPSADAGGSPAPHVMAVRRGDDLRLFIDGQIQFSSVDEYRYHEALVHPAMALAQRRRAVLVLGGGDGLAIREVLKYSDVGHIVLVDLDPEITELCRTNAEIVALNKGALSDPKVVIENWDGYKFVERIGEPFDVVIIDLPDPDHESLSKLYSIQFYRLLRRVLTPGGMVVTQSTSPFFSRYAFWCIHRTMEAAGLQVAAYHLEVPSLGDWGFNLASNSTIQVRNVRIRVPTLFLNDETAFAMFQFGRDIAEVEAKVNTLLRPHLLTYYDDDRWWRY